jgi:hypothetical protein
MKISAKGIILSEGEAVMPKLKKARTSGMVVKAGPVSVEIKRPSNSRIFCWVELLDYQQWTVIATQLQAEWAWPMTKYLGRILWALESRKEESVSCSGASFVSWDCY